MKMYGMKVNNKNFFYKFETDRNYAWNVLILTNPIAANKVVFFEIEMN